MVKFYDVSLPIREGMIVYPGNPEPSIRRYSSIPRDKVNESLITFGSHTGTMWIPSCTFKVTLMVQKHYPLTVFMENAEYLVEAGVKTLGFDYLSAKKYGGSYFPSVFLEELSSPFFISTSICAPHLKHLTLPL